MTPATDPRIEAIIEKNIDHFCPRNTQSGRERAHHDSKLRYWIAKTQRDAPDQLEELLAHLDNVG